MLLEVSKEGDKLFVLNEKSKKQIKAFDFDDFIGIGMNMQIMNVYTTHEVSGGCFSGGKAKIRAMSAVSSYHKVPEDSPVVLERFKKLVMRKFWKFQQKAYGSGIGGTDEETYFAIHRESWEKKVFVVLNEHAGNQNAKATFKSIEKYLDAYGFRME